MQKILRKRVLRDLKENFFRYLALGLLIVLGMYIVLSLIGAADTIILGTKQMAEQNKCEDGQFGLAFLTEDAYETLKSSGKSHKTESYYYAYRLNGKMTDEELKAQIKEVVVIIYSFR